MHECMHMIVHYVQKFHDSAGSTNTGQVMREMIVQLQNRRSTFMMEDGGAVAEVDAWLKRAQGKSCGSCAGEHFQKSEENQKHSSEADGSIALSTASIASKSNDYGGNHSYAVRTSHSRIAECERALCYVHPGGTKVGQHGCHGVELISSDCTSIAMSVPHPYVFE